MTFVQSDPIDFIQGATEKHDVAILSHCIWYFSSPDYLKQLLAALLGQVARVCIAEWALTATDSRAVPHLLATLTQASLECRKAITKSNIRTALSPRAINEIALVAGLHREEQKTFVPHEGLKDGEWEVLRVIEDEFAAEIEECVKDSREKAVVHTLRDSVRAIVNPSEREKMKAMDVWAVSYRTA